MCRALWAFCIPRTCTLWPEFCLPCEWILLEPPARWQDLFFFANHGSGLNLICTNSVQLCLQWPLFPTQLGSFEDGSGPAKCAEAHVQGTLQWTGCVCRASWLTVLWSVCALAHFWLFCFLSLLQSLVPVCCLSSSLSLSLFLPLPLHFPLSLSLQ